MLERRFKVRVQHCFAAGLALFMPLACGKALLDPDQAGGQCVPGMQIQCACPGALVGVQACQADKTFAECQCEGSGVAGNSSASNAGNAGAQASAGDGSTQGGEFGVAGQLEQAGEAGTPDGAQAGSSGTHAGSGGMSGSGGASAGSGGASAGSGGASAGSGGANAGSGGASAGSGGANAGNGGTGGGVCDLGTLGLPGALTTASTLSTGCALNLPGKVEHLTYDAAHERVYALDAANRSIIAVELGTGNAMARAVVQVPNAACVDASRASLFVVNSGSNYISEYKLGDLSLVRNIPWPAPIYSGGADNAHFHVYCGNNRLFVVDAAWAPGLWTIEQLDGCPTAIDHSAQVSAVGDLVLSPDGSELYYWYQFGWSAGSVSTAVKRFDTGTWLQKDSTNLPYPAVFYRDPLDAPVLWDRTRNLILSKNRVFDAKNLTHLVFSFLDPSDDLIAGAAQNAYALDASRGRFATRSAVYSLDDFHSLALNAQPAANQYFFDGSGSLRALVTATGRLECQKLP